MRNLSQFMSEFRGGFQQPNFFRACVFPPREMLTRMIPRVAGVADFGSALDTAGELAELSVALPLAAQWLARGVLVSATRIPSRSLETTGQRMYGITEQFPYNSEYTPLDMTFPLPLVAGDSPVPRFFNFWQNMVHAMHHGPQDGADMRFPEEYYGNIVLGLMDRKGHPNVVYKFEKAYPTMVASSELSWQSTNEVTMLTVSFQYSYHTILSRTSPEALALLGASLIGQ